MLALGVNRRGCGSEASGLDLNWERLPSVTAWSIASVRSQADPVQGPHLGWYLPLCHCGVTFVRLSSPARHSCTSSSAHGRGRRRSCGNREGRTQFSTGCCFIVLPECKKHTPQFGCATCCGLPWLYCVGVLNCFAMGRYLGEHTTARANPAHVTSSLQSPAAEVPSSRLYLGPLCRHLTHPQPHRACGALHVCTSFGFA